MSRRKPITQIYSQTKPCLAGKTNPQYAVQKCTLYQYSNIGWDNLEWFQNKIKLWKMRNPLFSMYKFLFLLEKTIDLERKATSTDQIIRVPSKMNLLEINYHTSNIFQINAVRYVSELWGRCGGLVRCGGLGVCVPATRSARPGFKSRPWASSL